VKEEEWKEAIEARDEEARTKEVKRRVGESIFVEVILSIYSYSSDTIFLFFLFFYHQESSCLDSR